MNSSDRYACGRLLFCSCIELLNMLQHMGSETWFELKNPAVGCARNVSKRIMVCGETQHLYALVQSLNSSSGSFQLPTSDQQVIQSRREVGTSSHRSQLPQSPKNVFVIWLLAILWELCQGQGQGWDTGPPIWQSGDFSWHKRWWMVMYGFINSWKLHRYIMIYLDIHGNFPNSTGCHRFRHSSRRVASGTAPYETRTAGRWAPWRGDGHEVGHSHWVKHGETKDHLQQSQAFWRSQISLDFFETIRQSLVSLLQGWT